MQLCNALTNLFGSGSLLRDARASGNLRVIASLLGPAYRGLIAERAKGTPTTTMPIAHGAHFTWRYEHDFPELGKLYELAKQSQWNAATDLDWTRQVDPFDPDQQLLPDSFLPVATLPTWAKLTERERNVQRHAMASWLLSQFLHGEQAALYAAAQVTQAVPWLEGKLFGSTQVVDEGRHVEVFRSYLTQKLERLYDVNDNLYVVIDAVMTDSRWDLKFLGMQILIEGLALGAFGTMRKLTREPLLKEVLRYVIGDEARHVQYGVVALRRFYVTEGAVTPEREDWTYEIALMLRNRFLAHEFYQEFYAHQMTRRQWDEMVLTSDLMRIFRDTMFRRIVPNLKRIGLLSDRIRPRYEELGVLVYEDGRAAPELTTQELLEEA